MLLERGPASTFSIAPTVARRRACRPWVWGVQMFWATSSVLRGPLLFGLSATGTSFSGTNAPFSGSLLAAAGFPRVASSSSVCVPAGFKQCLDLMGLGACFFESLVCYESRLGRWLPWKLTWSHSPGTASQRCALLICHKATQSSKLAFRKRTWNWFPTRSAKICHCS